MGIAIADRIERDERNQGLISDLHAQAQYNTVHPQVEKAQMAQRLTNGISEGPININEWAKGKADKTMSQVHRLFERGLISWG
jgi:hypothetical protein